MSKIVLIIEPSIAVRGIAESLLRQGGLNVISVETAENARQVLQDSKIDLILISSDVCDSQGQPFYEAIGSIPGGNSVPLLVLHDASSGQTLNFPQEVIINKPFTPRDFMSSVVAFTGQETQIPGQAPFDGNDIEDNVIDAALGIEKIEVDGSEVIGNDTGVFRLHNKKVTEGSMVGFEYKEQVDDSTITTKKNDSVNIPVKNVQQPQATGQSPSQKKQQEDTPSEQTEERPEFLGTDSAKLRSQAANQLSESSKIEIVTDQFGITSPEKPMETDSDDHDYNWFINELKNEGKEGPKASTDDSGSLNIAKPEESLSPSAPAPASQPPQAQAPRTHSIPVEQPQATPAAAQPELKKETPIKSQSEAVEKFISEFKKEMEKISTDDEPRIPVTNIPPRDTTSSKSKDKIQWDENLEDIAEPELKNLSRELIKAISQQVANKMVALLDEEKVYLLLREAITDFMRQRGK
ncbi:MAG: hypothetical protein V3V99_04265 [candidate division Zixibacteria bacterium]